MKRDLNLIKKILLKIEEADTYETPLTISIEEYDEDIVNYHIKIMYEAGLITLFGKPVSTFNSSTQYLVASLTWEGHEFLEASKNEKNWKKAINLIKDKGLGFTYDLVKGLLLQESLRLVGLK